MDGVEKVQSGHALGVAQPVLDLADQEGRCIAGQDCPRPRLPFQFLEDLLFGGQVFNDGFDYQVGASEPFP